MLDFNESHFVEFIAYCFETDATLLDIINAMKLIDKYLSDPQVVNETNIKEKIKLRLSEIPTYKALLESDKWTQQTTNVRESDI